MESYNTIFLDNILKSAIFIHFIPFFSFHFLSLFFLPFSFKFCFFFCFFYYFREGKEKPKSFV
ncbi:hypothetical protein LS66_000520 [Helicobacter sp. MIT 03-1614]|nr:hypothetical protein LS66_000520 [Helicobacter sp. MIT 03-1614]